MGCMGADKIYYMEYKTMNKLSEKKRIVLVHLDYAKLERFNHHG